MHLYRERSAEAHRTLPHERDLCYDIASGQCPRPSSGASAWGLKPVCSYSIHGGYRRMLEQERICISSSCVAGVQQPIAAADMKRRQLARLHARAGRRSRRDREAGAASSIAWLYRNGSAHGIDPERRLRSAAQLCGWPSHTAAATAGGHGSEASLGLPDDVRDQGRAAGGVGTSTCCRCRSPSSTNADALRRAADPGAESLSR